ncbi:MAG: UDP-N-acetylmuramate--L-alanine ligase [Halobacteriovoraceae bacterium]|nr:UDP-N-acetylmuramate--L-alanine ligase [Halobacteriovoraceae bacterium]|tara:strand:+ start:1402 stop:2778 length:1377 start_codon:yes stop_codon:yes gene_type:complete
MYGINKDFNIHFIGVGGIGMSGIAEILLNLGYKVSGSDLNENDNTQKLKHLGAQIFLGHKKENVQDAQLIVYSSAINPTNPEVVKATELRIPIIKRAEMLAELMRLKFGIAVAGSHGKTTTTSFLSTILKECQLNPTCIVGGIVKNLGGHALKGDGDILVAEADESDGSFLFLNPIMSVITNIDNDHLDYYKTVENLENSFLEFSHKVPFYGRVAINIEDSKTKSLIKNLRRPHISYGLSDSADYYATQIQFDEQGSHFKLHHQDEIIDTTISLSGEHNILNALGAIAIAHQLPLSLKQICEGIAKFEGVGRRFEIIHSDKPVIVDDYGHHPTEIKSTLKTARQKYPDKNIVAIFEPHRFTRTQEHWDEFVASFSDISQVYIAPIYPASEEPIPNITSENLIKDIQAKSQNAAFLADWDEVLSIIDKASDNQTVIVSLGAGSISKIMRSKVETWSNKK